MSYIGQGLPADVFGAYTVDTFTGDGSATTFTLSKAPTSDSALIVVVDNVIQQPTTNFTVSGTTLTIVGTAILSGIKGYAIHTQGKLPVGTATAVDTNGASDGIVLDTDADTTISADTDDQIDFKAGDTDTMHIFNGDVRVNTTTAVQPGSGAGLGVKGDVNISDFANDTSSSALVFTKSRNTTPGSQTIVNNGDQIGAIFFKADDGNASDYNNNVAAITAEIDTTPGTDDTPGRLKFFTTNDGERTNTERMRIDRNGKVLIGTTSDATSSNLQVITAQHNARNAYFTHSGDPSSAAPYGIGINYSNGAPDNDSNTANMFIYCSDTSAGRFVVAGDGDVLNHDNSYGQISDQRLKTNIADANSQWDDIKALKVRNFEKKDDIELHGAGKRVQIGVIAQELEAAGMNGLVKTGEPSELDIKHSSDFGTLYEDGDTIPDGKKIGDIKTTTGEKVRSVKYSVLYMKAIKALQEAMAKIETLETKVKALEDA